MTRKRKLPPGIVKRGNVYHCQIQIHGRRVRKRLSTDLDAAKQMLNDIRARADRGDFGQLDNDVPWAELRAGFLRWARQAVRNPQDYERDLDKYEEFCQPVSAGEVTVDRVVAYRAWRLEQTVGKNGQTRKISPRTVNREVTTLNNMLNKAVEWDRIGKNPIASIKPLRNDRPYKERRPLELWEVQALFDHSPEYLKPVWRTFMTTGMRKDELVSMLDDDIDFDRRRVTVRAHTAKSRKAREIPLDDVAFELLADLCDQAKRRQPVPGSTPSLTEQQRRNFTRKHVFVTRANTPLRNNLLRAFYSICRRAGIEGGHRGGNVDIHSLRVTFTTMALSCGGNIKDVQEILGHSTPTITLAIYNKATDRGKLAVTDTMARVLAAAQQGDVAGGEVTQKQPQVFDTAPNSLPYKAPGR